MLRSKPLFPFITKNMSEKISLVLTLFFLLVDHSHETTTPFSNFSPMTSTMGTKEMCDAIDSDQYEVSWPSTSDKTSSDPLCTNETKELVYRECSSGQWCEEPTCIDIQNKTPPQCPDGFSETEDFCFIATTKTSFPPPCPFVDVLPFNSYIDQIQHILVEPVWMPVTRDYSNGYGFLQWVEASILFRSYFDDDYVYYGGIKNKDCVVYHPNKTKQAVACSEQHSGICVYQKITKQNNTLCDLEDNCRRSNFGSRSECFCYSYELGGDSVAEFVEPYQNSVCGSLTDDICTIGLIKESDNTYRWNSSNQEISYTFWSPNVTFDEKHIYGASTSSGWILTEKPQMCYLVQKEVTPPELTYAFQYDSHQLILLNISDLNSIEPFDGKPTIFCSTTADYSSLYNLDVVPLNSRSHQIQILDTDPGTYWCEFFNRKDLSVVQTMGLTVRNISYFEFASTFEINFGNLDNFNPLSKDAENYIKEVILDKFDDISYTPKIWRIVDVFDDEHQMWVNIHFTSTIPYNNLVVDQQYKYLRNEVGNVLSLKSTRNLGLINLYNTEMCVTDTILYSQGVNLTWPATLRGQSVSPQEFCFTARGELVTRYCGGDFVNGARWSDYDKCVMLTESPISNVLLGVYNSPVGNISDIDNFLNSCPLSLFQALDVYILRKILSSVVVNKEGSIDTDKFVNVINTIAKIDKSDLVESQVVTHSTDSLIDLIDSTTSSYPKEIEIVKDNFGVLRNPLKKMSGVIVQQNGSVRNVTKLTGNWTFDTIRKQSNIVSAVWFDPELQKKIGDDVYVTFTLYFNDAFFGESVHTTNVASYVFGITVDNLSPYDYLPAPINIYQKMATNNTMKKNCSSWMYRIGQRAGFWYKDGVQTDANRDQLCQFWHLSHFTVLTSSTGFVLSDVTNNLAQLLGVSVANNDKVYSLVNLSDKSTEFVPMDVFLFGKVLETMTDNTTDLEALTKSVGNVHRSKRTVLLESQNEKQATDNILRYIDDIVQNCNNTTEAIYIHEHFALLVSDIRTNNLGGVVVVKNNDTTQINILRGYIDHTDISASFSNVDSAITLNYNLRKQLFDEGNIFISIFFNDNLFNTESSSHKYISTIYGVILPPIGNYTGPVSIFYNVSATENDTIDCSHWSIDNPKQTPSLWQKNDEPTNLSMLIQCDFWHTTHFALLILDREIDGVSRVILEWITYVCTGISLLGLCGIVLTAVLFEKWRQNIGNQILLNFTIAIIFQIIAFFGVALFDTSSLFICKFLGSLLHYSVIAQFCWMFVIAILQFKRFVEVFGTSPKYLLLRACLCGWGIPVVPVTVSLLISNDSYVKGNTGFCYPTGLGLYLGVWVPILIVIVLNLSIFVFVMYNVVHRNIEPSSSLKNEGKYHWRLFVLLFFMLGMTWTFGFLAEFDFGLVFAYMFCLTATLQGFVLFIYFVLLNSNTRCLYKKAFDNYRSRKEK